MGDTWVISVICLCFLFDFINGFHDAANSIATIVATHTLTPRQAVIWAALFNFIAFLCFELAVANTIGQGIVDPNYLTITTLASALLGAITWNLLTWWQGIPSSSSHALIGGLLGAVIAEHGPDAILLSGLWKVLSGIFLSPLFGIIVALILMKFIQKILWLNDHKVIKGLQLISSAFLSMTHGSNDAQKTMGLIAAVLFTAGWLHGNFYVPFWVVISCQLVISLGTLLGGWRIVNTMGHNITTLNPQKGCVAEGAAALVISLATETGTPVSTTHTVTGAIIGTGVASSGIGYRAINHVTLIKIFSSWLMTMPMAGLFAIIQSYLIQLLRVGSHY